MKFCIQFNLIKWHFKGCDKLLLFNSHSESPCIYTHIYFHVYTLGYRYVYSKISWHSYHPAKNVYTHDNTHVYIMVNTPGCTPFYIQFVLCLHPVRQYLNKFLQTYLTCAFSMITSLFTLSIIIVKQKKVLRSQTKSLFCD